MSSIKDVAKKAGVSVSTVSNVINNSKHVSDELTRRINNAIVELNYEVNPVARSLKSRKTMTLGVVITSIDRIFFPQVIKGIQDAASKLGYSLTLCSSNDSFDTEESLIQMLESNWVDGIILDSVAGMNEKSYFKKLSKLSKNRKFIPVISLERRLDYYGIDSVVVDNYHGGILAAQHLLKCECRKIAHITGPIDSCIVNERLKGFKDELDRNGNHELDKMLSFGDFSPLSGYLSMKELLITGAEIDGVFAANDQMAIGAIKAIKEHGFKIPEDIKVIGFDNTFVASIVEPSLTTVNVPQYRLGNTAVEALIRRIEHGSGKPVCIEMPINLIIRQSTDLKGDKNWDLYGW